MFMTGSGGSGKSKVIKKFSEHSKCSIENCVGVAFNKWVVTSSALTASAAVEINGNATHKCAGLRHKHKKMLEKMVEYWQHTLFLIVDEMSFMSEFDLQRLEHALVSS